MKQVWRTIGNIYSGESLDEMRVSHGAYPTPVVLDDGWLRIFFATRDSQNRSHISSLEIDAHLNDLKYRNLSQNPLLSPGPCGHFDDSGVTPGSFITVNGQEYLLYMGWNLGVTAPFRNSIGLARYDRSANTIERYSNGPFLSRSHEDPVNVTYPFVMRSKDGFLLWYGSDAETRQEKEGMKHVIKGARSTDFCSWIREERPRVELRDDELTVSRPTIIHRGGLFHMWYSFRLPGGEYEIGYAHSVDLDRWCREDDVVVFMGSRQPWEATGRSYPYVIALEDRIVMLYSGQSFGKTGFGIAEMIDGEGGLMTGESK